MLATSKSRIRRLASARYSCARLGSLKSRLLWAFEFRRPTMPLYKNMNPFCSSLSASVWRLLKWMTGVCFSHPKARFIRGSPSSCNPDLALTSSMTRIPSATLQSFTVSRGDRISAGGRSAPTRRYRTSSCHMETSSQCNKPRHHHNCTPQPLRLLPLTSTKQPQLQQQAHAGT